MTPQEEIARVFKALCDPKRVAILEELRSGEKCACHLAERLDFAQSALSYHMKILCESGLVESWYVGKWTHYKISLAGQRQALDMLESLTSVE